jgi:hypothetical protein
VKSVRPFNDPTLSHPGLGTLVALDHIHTLNNDAMTLRDDAFYFSTFRLILASKNQNRVALPDIRGHL